MLRQALEGMRLAASRALKAAGLTGQAETPPTLHPCQALGVLFMFHPLRC